MKKPKKKKQKQPQPQSETTRTLVSASASAGAMAASIPGAVAFEPRVALPEEAEPTAGRLALPVLIIAFFAIMFYVGMAYVLDHSGEFNPMVYYPHEKVPVDATKGPNGKAIFGANCAICHQLSGEGDKSLGFPPLAGSEWVLEEGPNRLIRIILNGATGPIEVKGEQYSNTMLPWRDTMTDEQIAAVLNYIRSDWGNKAPEVKPEKVAAVRKETAGRSTAWTSDELKAIPPAD